MTKILLGQYFSKLSCMCMDLQVSFSAMESILDLSVANNFELTILFQLEYEGKLRLVPTVQGKAQVHI